ncbi:MAG: Holliday junction resolvase RuvX [Oscillospiraceae bacterium]|nr:Holliday junction resolvase RuvX [Oscillospiraceae bacterium]
MKILGIDLGKARTGLAVSDSSEKLAFPLKTLKECSEENLLLNVLDIIKKANIKRVIVGLPKNMNATESKGADRARRFGRAIENKTRNVEVIMQDERMTTIIAHRYLNDANVKSRKRKIIVDTVAATVILQSFLDLQNSSSN